MRVLCCFLQGLQDTFSTNTFGPLMMAKHFGGLLQKGSGSFGADDKHAGVLVNMSAKVGSITDNGRSLLEDIHTRIKFLFACIIMILLQIVCEYFCLIYTLLSFTVYELL